jgi:hypothetical protein
MPVTETGYLCVADRVAELGLHVPNGFAILPDNFAQAMSGRDFRLRAEAASVCALFQGCRLPLENFTRGDELGLADNADGSWKITLFAPAGAMKREASALGSALQAISDHLKGLAVKSPRRNVSLSLVVERSSDRMCRKLTCEDDISGIASLAVKAIRIADM